MYDIIEGNNYNTFISSLLKSLKHLKNKSNSTLTIAIKRFIPPMVLNLIIIVLISAVPTIKNGAMCNQLKMCLRTLFIRIAYMEKIVAHTILHNSLTEQSSM